MCECLPGERLPEDREPRQRQESCRRPERHDRNSVDRLDIGREGRGRLRWPVGWDVAPTDLRGERVQLRLTVAKRDLQLILVRGRRVLMGAKECRSQADHIRETTAGERFEAARDRHHADQPEPLRFRLAPARLAAASSRGRHCDGHRVAHAQPEPLREGISGNGFIDRFGIGEPSRHHLDDVGPDASGVVRREEEDVRERDRVAPGGQRPGEQARTLGRGDLRKACDLIEDLVGARVAPRAHRGLKDAVLL